MLKNPFLFFDALYIFFQFVIYSISMIPSIYLIQNYWSENIWLNSIILFSSYFLFLNFFVLTLGILRRIFQPKLVEGEFPIGMNKKYIGWILNSLFQGIFIASIFAKQINFIFYLNWVYYRLMGMKVSMTTLIGMNVSIRQPELIEVGEKSILGLGCIISCHYSPNGKVHVQRRVKIGKKSVLGGFAALAPGVIVGDNSVIGARSTVYPDVIIGDNVNIGAECSIKFGSIIPNNVKIKGNTVIDKHCHIKTGEVWAGNPAMRIIETSKENI